MTDPTIITGQYVKISQTPASLGERFLARLIDYIIIAIYVIATVTFIERLPYSYRSENSFYILIFILYFPVLTYSLLFEVFNQGQSPGKKIMNIKVVMADGSTPALGGYILRWLLFLIDFTFTSGLGVLFILLTKNRQRIGDLAAGTMVIRVNNYRRIKVSLDEYSHLTDGYIPTYPQVVDLSFEQVGVIEKVLLNNNKKENYIPQLSKKIKELLKVEPKIDDKSFLEVVLRDYQYYAYVDI